MSVATPYPYSYMAKQLLVDLGVDVPRNAEFQNRALFEKYQLGAGTFFDKEHFGEDRLVAGTGRPSWPEFFAKAPLSDAARRDLARLYGKNPDYLHGKSVEQKLALLDPDQLPGVPADACQDEPRRAAVLPRPGRAQQQARRHDPGARSGARRPHRLRRPRPARRGVVPAGQLHVPLPGRQRLDRPTAGVAAHAQGDSRQPRHGVDRQGAAGGLRPSRRRRHADPDSPEQHGDAGRRRRPGRAADRRQDRLPARRQDAPGAGRERRARLLQRDDSEAAARAAGRTAAGAHLFGQGADALHQRAAAALDAVQAARRRQHQRARGCITRTPASIRARPSAATRA